MLKEMITLQSAGIFGSGVIGDLLAKWEQMGFFSYVLPFMLIFALVFGILIRVKIFKDSKMVNGIIALAVAFMALQFNFVPQFFSQIFPRVGIGLAIILGIMIILGLFMDPESHAVNYFLLGVGVLIIGLILIQSAGALGWASGTWWEENWTTIIFAVFILIIVALIIGGTKPAGQKVPYKPFWARDQKE